MIHNAIRDIIAEMYKDLHALYGVEVSGLYRQLTSHGEHKPADILVYSGSVHEKWHPGSNLALDVAVTDPCSQTALDAGSSRTPLIAAKIRHDAKKNNHRRAEARATADNTGPLDFKKIPLVFETSGAFSKDTALWFQQMVNADTQQQREVGHAVWTNRRLRELEWTWSANSFRSWHSQRLAMAHARLTAKCINHMIGKCQAEKYSAYKD